jgi:DNA polymerase/3'-5' exonuclease PolX
MNLRSAQMAADRIMEILYPFCLQCEVVGSVRREAEEVKDIEILVEPADQLGLEEAVRTERFTLRLDSKGRPCNGPRAKRLRFDDEKLRSPIALDLFICLPPAQYGVLKVLRTGPAELSRRLVTPRRLKGVLPDGWKVQNGQLFDKEGQSLMVPTEERFFELLNTPYIDPRRRSLWQEQPR